jgi:protein-S-isoprenylcysteine O-methyltransferase Ste14
LSRMAGIGMALFSLTVLYTAHKTLGTYFTTSITVKEGQKLMTTGPYRYIRHPMYTAYFILFVAAFLISMNWVIGVSGIGIIFILMTFRRKKEEKILIDTFKDKYMHYMKTTPSFIPIKMNKRNP